MPSSTTNTAVRPTLYDQDSSDDYAIIVLRGYKGVTGKYKVNLHTPLERLAELATSEDCPLQNVVLFFHGQRVLHSDCPDSLGIDKRSVVTIGYRMDFTKQFKELKESKEDLLEEQYGDNVKLVVNDASRFMEFVIGCEEPLRGYLNAFATKHNYGTKLTVCYNGFKIKASYSAKDLYVQKRHTFAISVSPKESEDSDNPNTEFTVPIPRLKDLNTPSMLKVTKSSVNTKTFNSLKKKRKNTNFPSSPSKAQVIHQEISSEDVDALKLAPTSILSHKKVTRGFRFQLIFGGNIRSWKTGSEFKKLAPEMHRKYCEEHGLGN